MSRPNSPAGSPFTRRYRDDAKPKRAKYELVINGRAIYEHSKRGPLEAKRRVWGGEIREVRG